MLDFMSITGLRKALRPVLLEACAATNRSSPYSECLDFSQYVLFFQKPYTVLQIMSAAHAEFSLFSNWVLEFEYS